MIWKKFVYPDSLSLLNIIVANAVLFNDNSNLPSSAEAGVWNIWLDTSTIIAIG